MVFDIIHTTRYKYEDGARYVDISGRIEKTTSNPSKGYLKRTNGEYRLDALG